MTPDDNRKLAIDILRYEEMLKLARARGDYGDIIIPSVGVVPRRVVVAGLEAYLSELKSKLQPKRGRHGANGVQ